MGISPILTTVVPYTLISAAVLIEALTRRMGPAAPIVGALVLVAPYSLVAAVYPLQRIHVRENDGMTQQIQSIASELPNELVLSMGLDRDVVAAILVAFDKPVVFVSGDLANQNDLAEVVKWIQEKAKLGRPAWILHGRSWPRAAQESQQVNRWTVTRPSMERPNRPMDAEAYSRTSLVILSRVAGVNSITDQSLFGRTTHWRNREWILILKRWRRLERFAIQTGWPGSTSLPSSFATRRRLKSIYSSSLKKTNGEG